MSGATFRLLVIWPLRSQKRHIPGRPVRCGDAPAKEHEPDDPRVSPPNAARGRRLEARRSFSLARSSRLSRMASPRPPIRSTANGWPSNGARPAISCPPIRRAARTMFPRSRRSPRCPASALRISGSSSWIRTPRCRTCNSRETRRATSAPISQASRDSSSLTIAQVGQELRAAGSDVGACLASRHHRRRFAFAAVYASTGDRTNVPQFLLFAKQEVSAGAP